MVHIGVPRLNSQDLLDLMSCTYRSHQALDSIHHLWITYFLLLNFVCPPCNTSIKDDFTVEQPLSNAMMSTCPNARLSNVKPFFS